MANCGPGYCPAHGTGGRRMYTMSCYLYLAEHLRSMFLSIKHALICLCQITGEKGRCYGLVGIEGERYPAYVVT